MFVTQFLLGLVDSPRRRHYWGMKTTLPAALLTALLLTACAGTSPPVGTQPLAKAQDGADSSAPSDSEAADSPLTETAAGGDAMPDSDPADGLPGDGQAADTQVADSSADAAKPLPNTNGLQVPPLPLPEFTQVVDSTGQSVSKDELLGHYTVLWFYPAASTGG